MQVQIVSSTLSAYVVNADSLEEWTINLWGKELLKRS